MYRQSEKNLLSSNTSFTCPDNMVNFGPLTAEMVREFGAPLQISTGFASWHRCCTASSSGRQPNFAALNRGRHLCSAGRLSGWALAHILVFCLFCLVVSIGLLECVWFCCIRFNFFSTNLSDWLGRTSFKLPICVKWNVKPYLSQS